MPRLSRPFVLQPTGAIKVNLRRWERDLIGQLAADFLALTQANSPASPQSYADRAATGPKKVGPTPDDSATDDPATDDSATDDSEAGRANFDAQLGKLLAGDADPAPRPAVDGPFARLFPAVYSDPDLEAEYQRYMRDDLIAGRAEATKTVIATVLNKVISAEEAQMWMRTINDIRLLMGTQLDISDEWQDEVGPDHPYAQEFAIYGHLTYVVGSLVDAFMGGDSPGFSDDDPEDELGGEPGAGT